MVDIGGYKLHMLDTGTGNPTVVIDAGGGCNTLDWSLVQPEIAKFTRVITYDRAGYAWSDASPLERTSENMVKELHAMLHSANIPAPYILVGHSLGGNNVQLFASMYPDEVAGVVLVDSNHEDQMEKLPKVDLPIFLKPAIAVTIFNLGIPRLFSGTSQVKSMFGYVEKYSPEIQKIYFSQKLTTKFIRSLSEELSHIEQDFNQLKRAKGGLLGDKPLTVITAGKQLTYDEVKGQLSQEQLDQMNKAWAEMQSDLVAKSSRGKQIIAEKSGHLINYDQPETIVDAVREMVNELKVINHDQTTS